MPTPASGTQARRERTQSAYLFWVLLLLPIDWFAPTGLLFREFGAKPATLLLTVGGILALLTLRPASALMARRELLAILLLALFTALNLNAFTISSAFGWSDVPNLRSPLGQFVNQTLLILAAALAMLGNARFFSRIDLEAALTHAWPRVAAIHLIIWMLEASFPTIVQPVMSPFRSSGISLERATGLMTEPSYYGTMAALYGAPMLLAPQFRGRLGVKLLAIALFVSAFFITAKTMIVVAGAQALLLVVLVKRGRILALLALLCVSAGAIYFIQTRAALDLQENMSSAMRLGSAHLAARVAATGASITGIGAGQFHFQFTEQNAPDYLLLSDEALEQMSPQAQTRASTYNFPLRVLVEQGILGLVLLLVGVALLMRGRDSRSRLQQMMLFGALGFLMTQDTYFYPALVLACALLLASPPRPFHALA